MMMTFFSVSTPSISTRSCGTIVLSMSELMPVPRVRNIESISSKNTMTGQPSSRLLPGPLEHEADLPLGLPHVLVEELGALDVEEVGLGRLAAAGRRHLLGQAVGHRLGDERLAAARAGRRGGCPWAPAAGARRTGPGGGTAARRRRRSSRSGRRGRRCPRSRCRAPPRGRGPPPRGAAASRAPAPSEGRAARCRRCGAARRAARRAARPRAPRRPGRRSAPGCRRGAP